MAKKGSTTTTQTVQTTNQVYTDQSASAAEGAIAVGAGANENIESLDAGVAESAIQQAGDTAGIAIAGQVEAGRTAGAVAVQALETTGETAGLAIAGQLAATREVSDVAGMSIAAQNVLAGRALETTGALAGQSIQAQTQLAGLTLETVRSFGEMGERSQRDILDTADLALRSQQGLTNKLADVASGALERQQTPESQTNKAAIWAAAIVAVIVGLAFIFKGRKTA